MSSTIYVEAVERLRRAGFEPDVADVIARELVLPEPALPPSGPPNQPPASRTVPGVNRGTSARKGGNGGGANPTDQHDLEETT